MFPEMHASMRGVMPLSSSAFLSIDVVERRCLTVVISSLRTASWSGNSVAGAATSSCVDIDGVNNSRE